MGTTFRNEETTEIYKNAEVVSWRLSREVVVRDMMFVLVFLFLAKSPWVSRRTRNSGLLCLREERKSGCQLPFTTELWR